MTKYPRDFPVEYQISRPPGMSAPRLFYIEYTTGVNIRPVFKKFMIFISSTRELEKLIL